MNKRIAVAALAGALLAAACVKEITSEERLERETTRVDVLKSNIAAELSKLKCDDTSAELGKARDASLSEELRLGAYSELYSKLKVRTARFEEAMAHDPDLAFQEGSQELVSARDGCVQSAADVRNELETLIREITQVLVVEDVRSGQNVKVARIDFSALRGAIEKLEVDDRDYLLGKITNAERQVDVKTEGPRKRNR